MKKKVKTQTNDLSKLILIFVIVCIVFIAFYGLTYLLKGNPKYTYNGSDDVTAINYENIIVGSLFKINKDSYYVLAYKKDDLYLDLYKSYISNYKESDKAINFYYINLDDGFNKKYVSDKQNIVNDINKITFKDTTLLKIEKGKIVANYTGTKIEDVLSKIK